MGPRLSNMVAIVLRLNFLSAASGSQNWAVVSLFNPKVKSLSKQSVVLNLSVLFSYLFSCLLQFLNRCCNDFPLISYLFWCSNFQSCFHFTLQIVLFDMFNARKTTILIFLYLIFFINLFLFSELFFTLPRFHDNHITLLFFSGKRPLPFHVLAFIRWKI